MTQLVDAVRTSLASGPKSTADILADCRRQGVRLREETVTLFLHLARGVIFQGGEWRLERGVKRQQLLIAMEKAFSEGGAYLPVQKLRGYLDDDVVISMEDLKEISEAEGCYQLQGDYIIRKR